MPLPPNPHLIDKLEYALQWLFCWLIIDIPAHPMTSGILTGLLLMVPVIAVGSLIDLILKLIHF
jgi:hypothetical protein